MTKLNAGDVAFYYNEKTQKIDCNKIKSVIVKHHENNTTYIEYEIRYDKYPERKILKQNHGGHFIQTFCGIIKNKSELKKLIKILK